MNNRGFRGIDDLFRTAQKETAPSLEIDLERILIDANSIQRERINTFKWMAIVSSIAALFTAILSYSSLTAISSNINELLFVSELYCYCN